MHAGHASRKSVNHIHLGLITYQYWFCKRPSTDLLLWHSDSLIVLGTLIKVNINCKEPSYWFHYFFQNNNFNFIWTMNRRRKNFQSLVEQLGKIIKNHDETTLTNLVFFKKTFKDLLPKQNTSFYRYSGSLTAPQCNEIVIWTVIDNPIVVSEQKIFLKILYCAIKINLSIKCK